MSFALSWRVEGVPDLGQTSELRHAGLAKHCPVVLCFLLALVACRVTGETEHYLPSAAAFGLAWVFHWYYGLLFFLGALIALIIARRKPKLAEEFTLPVASGVIAGGSLMGVVLIFWANGGSILTKLLGG